MPETHIDFAAMARLERAVAAFSPREVLVYSAANALAQLRFRSNAAGALACVRAGAARARQAYGHEDVSDLLDAFAETAAALAEGDTLFAYELLNGVLDADMELSEPVSSQVEAARRKVLH